MFIGHFGVAMAGKRVAPKVSLPVLFLAAVFADTLWPFLVAAGIETVRIAPGDTKYTPLEFVSYPWSHSLLLLIVWGVLFGVIYRLYTGDGRGVWNLRPAKKICAAAAWRGHRSGPGEGAGS